MSVDDMVKAGELERVEPDSDAAEAMLSEARQHVASARAISGSDPNGAYQLAYDAARKAATSSMRAAGLRVRKGEGGHVITAKYAGAAIETELGKRLEAARRRRNRSEYGSTHFDDSAIADAVGLAEELIAAVS